MDAELKKQDTEELKCLLDKKKFSIISLWVLQNGVTTIISSLEEAFDILASSQFLLRGATFVECFDLS